MITSLHIENFRCFKDFDIELGPFNVLIGANDTGKTTFLQAVRLLGDTGAWKERKRHTSQVTGATGIALGAEAHWGGDSGAQIRFVAHGPEPKTNRDARKLVLTLKGDAVFECDLVSAGLVVRDVGQLLSSRREVVFHHLAREIGTACYYQFDPSALRRASALFDTMTERGRGFPTFLDDIKRAPRSGFPELEREFCVRFPYYDAVAIGKEKVGSGKEGFVVNFRTVHGQILSADAVSDGVMLSLVFMALPYSPEPPGIYLIEEPENGVHHAGLREIVKTLRALSDTKGVQVVMTTHSPYLLDLVEPEDVRIFWKDQEGAVHAMKMSEAKDVDEMKKHFMTGEIWTIETEANLLGKARGK
jgi:predicted ATPase